MRFPVTPVGRGYAVARRAVFAALAVLIVAGIPSLQAAKLLRATHRSWEPIGPNGDDQFKVLVSPDNPRTVFALGFGGIHRSQDGGDTWDSVGGWETARCFFRDMAFNPTNALELVGVTAENGVWRSGDGGDTWEQRNAGLPRKDGSERYYPCSSVTFGRNGALLVGLREDGSSGLPPALVYASYDAGMSWQPADTGLPAPNTSATQGVTALVSADVNTQLWAAVYGSGVFTFSGGRWRDRSANLPGDARRVTFLAHDTANASNIVIGTEDRWIYATTNAGGYWASLPLPAELESLEILPIVYCMAIDPNNTNLMWVQTYDCSRGVRNRPLFTARPDQDQGGASYLTVDGGRTWTVWPDVPQTVYRVAIDPSETTTGPLADLGDVLRSKTWYLATGDPASLRRSTNGVASFAPAIEGLRNFWMDTVASLSVSVPGGCIRVLTSSEANMFGLTNESAQSWSHMPGAEPAWSHVSSFADDPARSNAFFYSIGEPAWNGEENKGVHRMDLVCSGDEVTVVRNQLLYGTGVWRVITTPAASNLIYAACQEDGVLMSEDSGQTWTAINNGLPLPASVTDLELDDQARPRLAACRLYSGDPDNNPILWGSLDKEPGGLYRYDVAGEQWVAVAAITNAVYDLESTNGITYAATAAGIFCSTNDSEWIALPLRDVVHDVLCHPSKPGYIFAATGSGVLRSTDGGLQWHDISEGLSTTLVRALAVDSETGTLYAGTRGRSVFQLAPADSPEPELLLFPETLSFGNVEVGMTSTQRLLVANAGEADLDISEVATNEVFFGNDMPALPRTITPGSWIEAEIVFAPLTNDAVEYTMLFYSNDPNSPTGIVLNGTGVVAEAHLDPAELDFGVVEAGTTSTYSFVSITNSGLAELVITSVTGHASFPIDLPGPLPLTLAPGDTGTAGIRFVAGTAGPVAGQVLLHSNDPASPTVLSLSGRGAFAQMDTLPAEIDFGAIEMGTTSSYQTVTVTNVGEIELVLTDITSAPGLFAYMVGNSLPETVQPGGYEHVRVHFAPPTTGGFEGRVLFHGNVEGALTAMQVSGRGAYAQAEVVPPAELDFGQVEVGTMSTFQSVTITNVGEVDLVVTGISASAGFTVTPQEPLPSVIPPGYAGVAGVRFAPDSTGTVEGEILFLTNAEGPAPAIAVTGTGLGARLRLSVTNIDFGYVPVGSVSAVVMVGATNTGLVDLTLTDMITSDDFPLAVMPPYPVVVPPGASGQVGFRFEPRGPGPAAMDILAISNDPDSPSVLRVTGMGYEEGEVDSDKDGMFDWQEAVAGTDPHNPTSLLAISSMSLSATSPDCVLEWNSCSGRIYSLDQRADLATGTWVALGQEIAATPPLNTHTVTVDQARAFYRIGVRLALE